MKKNLLLLSYAIKQREIIQILRIMKCTVLLLFLLILQAHASVSSQNARVNMSRNQLPLKEFMAEIEKQTDYLFIYSDAEINASRQVTVKKGTHRVADLLREVLSKNNISYNFADNYISLHVRKEADAQSLAVSPQQKKNTVLVSGTIVDTAGDPIIGANIKLKGAQGTGTITDVEGNFKLEVPTNGVLIVSFIGYQQQEVAVNGKTMLKIKMAEDAEMIDEVVVTALGIKREEKALGYAVQKVGGSKLSTVKPVNIATSLTGKVAGLNVTNSTEFNTAPTLKLRGETPLLVVDGVPYSNISLNDIAADDIESVDVLKGATASALYGARGGSGAIMVTTKKGKIGKATINASVKMGVNQLHRGNMNMMNGEELYDYYKSFANQDALPSYFTEDLRNRNFDWWKEGTHLGFAQDYNVSVSGGSEKIKTYTSVGYYNEDGAVKGYDYKRYNLRFNVDYQATDWLTIKPKVWATRSDVMDQQQDLGAIMYVNFPWDSPYDENGDLIQQYRPTDWVNSDATNYLYDLQWNYEKKTSYEFMGNFDFDIKFTDWLTFASVNSYKYNNILFKGYNDPRSKAGEADNGLLQDKTTTSYRVYSNQLLRFNKVFDKHSINAILAYEWNSYTREIKDQTAASFAPGFSVADVATTPKTIKGSQEEWAVQSYLFNANYAYDNRYLLSFSFRRDGASNFGEDAKYGNFFSVSGGWNIHQEEFFKAKDWVQQLKLRASYGSVGNRPTELYSQYTLYAMSTGYNGDPGAVIAQKENKNLTWEKTYTAGVGIDAILFDRLTINLDYYNKKTTDLLYKVPLPGVTGITGIYRNVGSVKNNGFEVSLGVDILKGGDWNWSVAANLGLNRNKITELYGGKSEIITANAGTSYYIYMDKILTPGQDVDTWYGTEWAGVDPQTGAPLWYTTNEEGERVTTSDYSEASKHQTILGKLSPDFYGGFSTNLSWKNIDLSAVFGYSVGGEIYNYDRSMYDSDGAYVNYNQMNLRDDWNRWEKPGDIATHPKAEYGNKSQSSKGSSRYLEDASYLRLRSLTLGYTLPWKIQYVDNVRLSFSGENLFVLSGFSGVDPELPAEVGSQYKAGSVGVAISPYPQARKFMFGLNVTF